MVDILHHVVSLLVDFFIVPTDSDRVLTLLESAHGHAAGVGCFSGGVENVAFLEGFDCLDGGWHVGAFGDCADSVFDEFLLVLTVEFILARADCAF